MIIARSPLRISLGGGGTDLPSYYREHEGFLLSAAIDKYVYVNINKPFTNNIKLKYSSFETVKKISEIKHPIIREVLDHYYSTDPVIEITSFADIPSGTGLGSSGSFTTALIKGINGFNKTHISQEAIAQQACYIEMDRLAEPVGKQDQYISAYGGISCFAFHKDDSVGFGQLNISDSVVHELEDRLLLFFTGYSRSAGSILQDQNDRSVNNDGEMTDNLHYVKDLGYQSKIALEEGNVDLFGQIMNKHWENKKKRSHGMSNNQINEWYDSALKNGAIGGKLVGAGGGGFLMFLANDTHKLKTYMKNSGLEEVRFKFDFEGSKLI